jgi:hypothetical protein
MLAMEAQDMASRLYVNNIRGSSGFIKGFEHFERYTQDYEDQLVEAMETIEELAAEADYYQRNSRPGTAVRSVKSCIKFNLMLMTTRPTTAPSAVQARIDYMNPSSSRRQ